jgi:3-deoxy-D-manno-octulosonic-acid transferase
VNLLDVFYGVGLLAAVPVLGWKSLRHGKYRESVPAMLGRGLTTPNWSNGCVWVHAVSVGEVGAAKAILPLVRESWPNLPILVTTVTETGQAAARRTLNGLADHIAYWPADFTFVVDRFLDAYQPRILLLMETELWPNILTRAARRGVLVFAINGKISRRSFPRYQRLQWLLGRAFRSVAGWCMQTEDDCRRVAELTGRSWPDPTGSIAVTGNVKFDLSITPPSSEELADLRTKLGLLETDQPIIIGSTHPGEEEALLAALHPVVAEDANRLVLLVPRHPERFAGVWDLLARLDWRSRRMSDGATQGPESGPRLVLVDGMGLLVRLYALGELAIVAGSFVGNIGGHNVLEPAALERPVLFGPQMKGQPDMARALLEADGAVQCPLESLANEVRQLLLDPQRRRDMARRGRAAVERNRGAARRSMDLVRRLSGESP